MGESTDQESRYIIDLVGEETSLDECALCHAVSCFSCVKGYCTALEKVTVGGCVFYKDAAQNWKEIRRCFYRLISPERFDLLRKYADTIAALGGHYNKNEATCDVQIAANHDAFGLIFA
jgi:hypothetical protein